MTRTSPYRIKTDSITINVRVEGSGPPLLFLGGSNFDLSLKAPVFDSVLPEHFTVAAADPRGLGFTDAPDGDWSMLDYARDAVALLDALEWKKPCILGESFGAMTALHMAGIAPERIDRLALAAASPGGEGGSSYPIQEFLTISNATERAKSVLSIIDSRWASTLATSPDSVEADIIARIDTEAAFMASHNNATGYPRLLAARSGHDACSLLPTLTHDTIVFAGRYDNQAPLDRARYLATTIPRCRLHVIEGGHAHCFNSVVPSDILVSTWC